MAGRVRRGALLFAVVGVGMLRAPARAQLDPCSDAVATAVERYALAKWRAVAACERRRTGGAAIENCRPAAGRVTDARTRRRLGAAARAVDRRVRGACGAHPPSLGTACGGGSTATLVACITSSTLDPDVHVGGVDRLAEVIYGGAVPGAERGLRACRLAVGSAAATYLEARLQAAHACATSQGPAQVGPCPDGAASSAFGAARAAFALAVQQRCTDAQAAGTGLGLGAPCESYLATSFERIAVPGNPDANVILALDRLTRCVGAVAAASADRLASVALSAPAFSAFREGIAAGDVTDHGAVFWTRLPVPGRHAFLDVGTDPTFRTAVRTFGVDAAPGDDGTVKRDVALRPATQYFYRFRQGDETSLVGQVRTAPDPSRRADVVFGWSGGSNPYFRPFSTLDQLRAAGVAAFFYTGDTIYADDPRADGVVATTFGEFARKYRMNRHDPALRSLLQSTATFAQWDDRETAKDLAGAEPAFSPAMAEANRAFRRYLPLREDAGDPTRLHRSVRWGSLVEVFLLDARQYRSAKIVCCADGTIASVTAPGTEACPAATGGPQTTPDANCVAALSEPSRSVLGAAQTTWLEDALLQSDATFKFVLGGPAMASSTVLPYDRWEDYPRERAALLDFVRDHRINAIFLTTDPDGVFVSTPGVDADHRIPEATAGPLASDPFLRTLPGASQGLLDVVPESFPAVTRFEIDRANVVLIKITGEGLAFAKLEYRDAAGQVIQTVTFRAAQ